MATKNGVLPAYSEKDDCIFLPAGGITSEHNLAPTLDPVTDEMPAWWLNLDKKERCFSEHPPGDFDWRDLNNVFEE